MCGENCTTSILNDINEFTSSTCSIKGGEKGLSRVVHLSLCYTPAAKKSNFFNVILRLGIFFALDPNKVYGIGNSVKSYSGYLFWAWGWKKKRRNRLEPESTAIGIRISFSN